MAATAPEKVRSGVRASARSGQTSRASAAPVVPITVSNRTFGPLDGTEIYLSQALHDRLSVPRREGVESELEKLQGGRALRALKHLIEAVRSKPGARLVLTDQPSHAADGAYHVNYEDYRNAGQSRFFTLYRSVGLDVAGTYLRNSFPEEFASIPITTAVQTVAQVQHDLPDTFAALSARRGTQTAVIEQTTSMVRKLRREKRLVRGQIRQLEELKRESSIAFYQGQLDEFRSRLSRNIHETRGRDSWQNWIYENNWVFGVQYLAPLDRQRVGFHNIPDFLFPTLDGFLDILEIKRPSHDVVVIDPSHPGSFAWSGEANRAIGQVVGYIHQIELHQLELEKTLNEQHADQLGVRLFVVRPRAFILIGNTETWAGDQMEGLRKLNHSLHGIEVVPYNHLVQRGERLISLYQDAPGVL